MPVLDTSFLVDLMREDGEALDALARIEEEYHNLATTVVNLLELFRGAYLSERREENSAKVLKIVETLDVIGFAWETYPIYGTLSATLKEKGISVNEFDVVIAALVLETDGIIVTRDQHFRSIPGLEVIGY
ncbi:MAG: type II toxin-antitoxin system VapC family toxin [Methanomicrobiales archaeon]|nr:type II toxin-antitoxin system VapC family toxin [Methanomicrobiales archaeon]MDD1662950.1 type II toxin-antitoxin system VapC family toxin [Methanomicrobiales archaeon]